MTWDQLQNHWEEFAGSARAHWGRLTDGDGQQLKGSKQQLIERIEQRYAVSASEAERQVDEWAQALPDLPKARAHSR